MILIVSWRLGLDLRISRRISPLCLSRFPKSYKPPQPTRHIRINRMRTRRQSQFAHGPTADPEPSQRRELERASDRNERVGWWFAGSADD